MSLSLQSIQVRFRSRIAVDAVSLEIKRGEIVGVVGPSGSGKSSLLAVAAGILHPNIGTVSIDGVSPDQDAAAYARHVGYASQAPALYDMLSVEANLVFFGRLYGFHGFDLCQRVDRMLRFANLEAERGKRVSSLSKSRHHQLHLACALLHNPEVLIFDEPAAALDPATRDALFLKLHELRDRGHAILLSTSSLDEVEYGFDRLAVLNAGRLVACDRPAALIRYHPAERAVIYAQLREQLPRFFERGLQRRIGRDVEVEVVGRRLRLAAPTQAELGRALAMILADGIVLETLRTPPGRLDGLNHPMPVSSLNEGASCDAR